MVRRLDERNELHDARGSDGTTRASTTPKFGRGRVHGSTIRSWSHCEAQESLELADKAI